MATNKKVKKARKTRSGGGRQRRKHIGCGPEHLMPDTALRFKHFIFAREYATNGGNGAAAAETAGVSPNSSKQTAFVWLNDPRIGAEVERQRELVKKEMLLDQQEVLSSLAAMLRTTVDDFCVDDSNQLVLKPGRPESCWLAVRGLSYNKGTGQPYPLLFNRYSGLNQAMTNLGLLIQRHEHTGKDGGPIETAQIPLKPAEKITRLQIILAAANQRASQKN